MRREKLQELQAERLAFVNVQALFLLAQGVQSGMGNAGCLRASFLRKGMFGLALHEVCCYPFGHVGFAGPC